MTYIASRQVASGTEVVLYRSADGFAMGDYITLAASRGRLATAFILPRHAGPVPDSAAVYVSVLAEPPAR